MSRTIPISRGYVVLVDDADYDWLMQWKWTANVKKCGVYAMRGYRENGKQRNVYMHRQIANPPDGLEVDHKNRNTLDNRRDNLRSCTRSQNFANRKKVTGTSVYKGVNWDAHRGRWLARIEKDGKQQNLGRFDDERAAARAYDKAAVEVHGEFALINFPTP